MIILFLMDLDNYYSRAGTPTLLIQLTLITVLIGMNIPSIADGEKMMAK